ncbi:MAG TPA: class I SAM-dependent methyltransferase [Dissulfurispiraceae bacterium]|nr:class I SAM-dependent methyltransferase [Dissulfurispiraceae bacterium]
MTPSLLRAELPAIRPGGLALTERVLRHCPFGDSARIADIGCGAGATVEYIRRTRTLNAVGVDISMARLREGLGRIPGMPLLQADAGFLPLANGSMDGIISECSLSVMHDRGRVLGEFHRVLKTDGRLLITDVVAENPEAIGPADFSKLPFCLSELATRESLSDSIARHGFRIDITEDHSYLLKTFIGRLIMESDFDCCGFNNSVVSAGLEALKRARPRYILLVATKGDDG